MSQRSGASQKNSSSLSTSDSGEAHLALHGIPRSRKEARRILESFESDGDGHEHELEIDELVSEDGSEEEDSGGTQFSLDSF